MSHDESFGQMVRQERRALDLTQEELARRVGCAAITVRKVEAGDLRPSQQIAERLAMSLAIPLDGRAEFVRQARAVEPAGRPIEPPHPAEVTSEEIGLADLSGRAIRGYQLGEKIGAGSFGAVYRAVQPLVEREVAIKIILPKYANHPDFIRRFEAEAQLVARLEHPHIVPLYDYWREPGVAYLVMRLLRGGSLHDLIERGPLPLDQIAHLLEQIGSALQAAHRAGVVHRDLKPSNVLLDEDYNAYLADFGIAKNLGSPETQTQVGLIIGSPDYISPEQALAEPVRPQTDIYSLGLMVYEMLTGAKPFTGPTPILLIQQHLYAPMPPLAAHRSGLPAALDDVIARATAKDPLQRYAGVDTLLADFKQVVQTGRLAETITLPPTAFEPPCGEIVNPYKGLRPFEEADAPDFFGREALTQQLLARLGEGGDLNRFLAVVGPSGCGKSSVVGAGLIPALRRGGLPHSENWFIVEVLPGSHPLEELEAALLRVAVNPPESLLAQIKEDRRGLLRAIQRALPADPNIELVLVLDQFEEVFTLVADEAERSHLLDSLVTTVLDERSRARVIVTLRADFIDKPLRYMDFGELMQRRSELVLPLTPDEMERAIVGPADRVGLGLEAGLPEAISADVSDQPGALPLMQYALTELFERRVDHTLTKAAYHNLGGVKGALGRRAEEVYLALSETDCALARQVFLRLVTLGEGVEDTRRRVLLSELETLSPIPSPKLGGGRRGEGEMDAVLAAFGKARLLSFDRDLQTRGPTMEVAHEALLREWPRLREWLSESRGDVRLQRLLANETAEWLSAKRENSFLLHGSRLQQFEDWAKTTSMALTNDERAYLEASIDERKARESAESERQRRELAAAQKLVETEQHATIQLRRRALWLTGALVVAGFLAVVALIAGQQATQHAATAQRQAAVLLASQAETELANGYHDRAVLLALEALTQYPYTSQAEHALAQAVSYSRAVQQYTAHQSAVTSIAWSTDGTRVATSASSDNNVHIWEPATGKTLRVIEMPRGITGNKLDMALNVQWTPDGKRLLTITGDRYTLGSQDYDVLLWDAASGELISSVQIPNQAAPESGELGVSAVNYMTGAAADIARQSNRLATLGGDNTAIIWDAAWQKPALVLSGHTKGVNSVDWSPDESKLATSSLDGTARIWDSRTGQVLHVLQGHQGRVNLAVWSPDGHLLATAGEDGVIRLWESASGKLVNSIPTNMGAVCSLAWAPNGQRFVTGHEDSSLRIWETESGKLLETLRGHQGTVSDLKWSPVDDRLASSDGSGFARIWNAALSTAWRVFPPQEARGGAWSVQGASWSSDGRFLAMAGGDPFASTEPPAFSLWDVQANQLTMENLGDKLNYMGLEAHFSPDDKAILYLGYPVFPDFSGLATTYVFDAKTGQIIRTFTPGGENLIRSAAWSPDGSQVATGLMNGEIMIWDFETGEKITTVIASPNAEFIDYVEWSPDGSKFAADIGDSAATAGVWDAYTWDLLYTLQHQPPTLVNAAAWSPDGMRLLTVAGNDEQGAKDNTARVWDSTTGKELLVFAGHTKSVWPGDWSPNGKRIATFSNDGTVKVWDSTTGADLLTLSIPVGYGGYTWWSPDGQHLAIVGHETLVSIWRVWQSTDELIQYAKECCVFRELTAAERQQFGLSPK